MYFVLIYAANFGHVRGWRLEHPPRYAHRLQRYRLFCDWYLVRGNLVAVRVTSETLPVGSMHHLRSPQPFTGTSYHVYGILVHLVHRKPTATVTSSAPLYLRTANDSGLCLFHLDGGHVLLRSYNSSAPLIFFRRLAARSSTTFCACEHCLYWLLSFLPP